MSQQIEMSSTGGKSTARANMKRPALPMRAKERLSPLFWFPYNVNDVTTRVIGLLVAGLSIMIWAAVIYNPDNMWPRWIACGILGDFCLRFIGGARISPIGAVAEWIALWFPPKPIPAAPKQFAVFCGIMFSAGGVIAFFAPDPSPTAGAILFGLLTGAAALEGLFGVCLGCIMFSWLIQFGIMPKRINANSEQVWDEQNRFAIEADRRLKEGNPVEKVIYDPQGEDSDRTVPYVYKQKTDEMKWEDFHAICHMHIHYFSIPMSLAGLAAVWQLVDGLMLASNTPVGVIVIDEGVINGNYTDSTLWRGIGVFSGVIGGIFAILYLLKLMMFPRKIVKEWKHPIKSNFFSTATITLLLYAFIVARFSLDFAKVLFWIGAPLQLFQAVVITARWITRSQSKYTVNPSWMMPAVGNLVAAFVGPALSADYREAGWLWFSFAFLMYIALFTLTLQRAMFGQPIEDRMRPLTFIWVAAPAVAFVAYLQLSGTFDMFARFLFFDMLVTFFVLTWCFFSSYYGRNLFEVGYWAYVFPLDTVALATVVYWAQFHTNLTLAMATIALILVNTAAVVVLANTFASLLRRRLFVPEDKWGPLSFTKILHFAIREAVVDILKHAEVIHNEGSQKPAADEDIHAFRYRFERIQRIYEIHSTHEDQVLFPMLRQWFPTITFSQGEEHANESLHFTNIAQVIGTGDAGRKAFDELDAAGKLERCRAAAAMMKELAVETLNHMDNEEINLSPIIRKHVSTKMQKQMMSTMFALNTPVELKFMFGFALEFAPFHGQRARFVHCLRWAFPERMQLYGQWMYEATSPLTWSRLMTEVPDMAPRHTDNWLPYY
ncbi:hypothetical protein CAOG_07723 [Capsaspora owczarzaki ATCC 30864]|nr:hypothetical protein CAOG_07723 [Capsaspora owczarzaki ATCC 30864]|eukprot:XP_004343597.2 hypothetical protein CAOG_07723 [Capsaspora owczarzaki ATCC 30864]